MNAALPSSLARLGRLSACTVANAIETLELRLRNEGFTNNSIRAYGAAGGTFVGHAVTLKIRGSSPPTDGHQYLESTQWWNQVLAAPAPRVVVIQDIDPTPGAGALIGEIHANILKALGCVGVVTNGAVRDLPALERIQFHAHAGGLAVSHAYSHIVERGGTVEVAGLKVAPDDLLLGDVHGIVSIPRGSEEAVADAAEILLRREKEILGLCEPAGFSLEALRAAITTFRSNPL